MANQTHVAIVSCPLCGKKFKSRGFDKVSEATTSVSRMLQSHLGVHVEEGK